MMRYTRSMKHKGFTVIELLTVIVVMVILASVVIVAYGSIREDGLDTDIRNTVKVVGDAIALRESQSGRITGEGIPSASNSIDTLTSGTPQYLKPGYRDKLSSRNATNSNTILKWYNCPAVDNGFIVYASLNRPTAEDTAMFNKLRTACAHGETQAPTSGVTKYNYAQVF